MNAAAYPSLAAIPSPMQGVWHLGPLPLRAYAVCIVLGIAAACIVTEVRMRHRGAPPGMVLDIALWAVPFGIVGARIYHVITTPEPYFGVGGNPIEALYVWRGGLGIWGAVSGGALGVWFACRSLKIPFSFVADALAPGLPLAQAIGRLGNWFNNELYGLPTNLPWGLKIYEWDTEQGRAFTDAVTGEPLLKGIYHPAFLYELLWNLGTALLVYLLDRRYRFGRGRAFAVYVMAYTVGRFWIEALRIDDAHHFLGLRLNDWTAILVFVGALVYFVRVRGPQVHLVTGPNGELTAVPVDELTAVGTDQADPDSDPADPDDGAADPDHADAGVDRHGARTAGVDDPDPADDGAVSDDDAAGSGADVAGSDAPRRS